MIDALDEEDAKPALNRAETNSVQRSRFPPFLHQSMAPNVTFCDVTRGTSRPHAVSYIRHVDSGLDILCS